MHITENDLAILVPVYKSPKEDLENFFLQLSKTGKIPYLFFAYEKGSCDFNLADEVKQWCDENNTRYEILELTGGAGLGFALHSAVNAITKKYIMRHDLGDEILPNRLSDSLNELNRNPKIDILYTQAILKDRKKESISKYPLEKRILAKSFAFSNPICHPTVVFKRRSILKIGNYDTSLRYCEDLDLWLRAYSQNLNFHCLNKATITYLKPDGVRLNANWRANLKVRIKNFGSPNYILSLIGIIAILIFLVIPDQWKGKVYKYVRN